MNRNWGPPPKRAFTDGLDEQFLVPVLVLSVDWREVFLDKRGELKRRRSLRHLKPIESLSLEDRDRLVAAPERIERPTPSE